VAVALLPPLAASGITLAAGRPAQAAGAALLFAANLLSVNLAAVATFRLQGLKPSLWWQAERAKRRLVLAFLIWGGLLGLLVLLLLMRA